MKKNAVRVAEVIAINVVDEVSRLCVGGALWSTLFSRRVLIKKEFKK